MPRLAANLSLLYTPLPFAARFEAAARDGFDWVECQFPYELTAPDAARALHGAGLRMALINAPAGDWSGGERGLAALPGREAEFRAALDTARRYADALQCPRVHLLSGITELQGQALATLRANLRWACAAAQDLTLCIEPINRGDFPGYALHRQQQALDLIAEIGAPNLKLQFDAYHCQVAEGDVTRRLDRALDLGVLGHVQVAAAPSRREPDEGELRVEHLLEHLDARGWSGVVGCEYRPRGDTSAGLAWARRWLRPGVA